MFFEYNMTEQMAKELLNSRKGNEKKTDPQTYLINIVNTQFGLLHPVNKVVVTL